MRRRKIERKYERIEFHLPMQFTELGKDNAVAAPSVTGNICQGGVSFKSDIFIPLAGRFMLEILLPSMPVPVRSIAKVAWIRRIPASSQFDIGSQFLEISRKDRNRVASLIEDTKLNPA